MFEIYICNIRKPTKCRMNVSPTLKALSGGRVACGHPTRHRITACCMLAPQKRICNAWAHGWAKTARTTWPCGTPESTTETPSHSTGVG